MSEFPDLGDYSDNWIIVFSSENKNWWARFFKKECSHCFAFTYYPILKCWMVYEHTSGRTDIRLFTTNKLAYYIAAWEDSGCKFVVFKCNYTKKLSVRLFLSCVSVIKHLLGLRHCYSLTPYQLYRWLMAHGGVDYMKEG